MTMSDALPISATYTDVPLQEEGDTSTRRPSLQQSFGVTLSFPLNIMLWFALGRCLIPERHLAGRVVKKCVCMCVFTLNIWVGGWVGGGVSSSESD